MSASPVVIEEFRDNPAVTAPPGGVQGTKMFGASALKVRNKIFAMLVGGSLVVKLPRHRVDALLTAGEAARFDPGHGRPMKKWVAVEPTSGEDWTTLAQEAMAYVESGL